MPDDSKPNLHCFVHGWQVSPDGRCPECAHPPGGKMLKPEKIEFPKFEADVGDYPSIEQVVDEN